MTRFWRKGCWKKDHTLIGQTCQFLNKNCRFRCQHCKLVKQWWPNQQKPLYSYKFRKQTLLGPWQHTKKHRSILPAITQSLASCSQKCQQLSTHMDIQASQQRYSFVTCHLDYTGKEPTCQKSNHINHFKNVTVEVSRKSSAAITWCKCLFDLFVV